MATSWLRQPDIGGRLISAKARRADGQGATGGIGARRPFGEFQARQLLIALRDREIYQQWPDADRTRGLLRQSMLDVLLRTRPQTFSDFDTQIANALREKTDADQLKTYGDRVFSILARMSD